MVLIIENNNAYTIDATYEQLRRGYDIYLREKEANRISCRKRYVPTGRPRGRPRKNSPVTTDSMESDKN